MGIVGGLDIHRRQITFNYLDERSGETRHGRIACRASRFLAEVACCPSDQPGV
jgi:hypothetical protein